MGRLLPLVLAVTAAVYLPCLDNDFTYDDRYYVRAESPEGRNAMVAEIQPLADYFDKPMGYGGSQVGRGFRPVTVLSYAVVNAATDGVTAWPHHLLNLVLHVAGVVLTFLMVRQLTGADPPSLLGAFVFGLCAIRSEAVISIVGRGELLPFVLGGAATLVHLRAMTARGTRRAGVLIGLFALLLTAFLCKEGAVAWAAFLPIFALAVAWHRGEPTGASLKQQIPGLLVAAVAAALFFYLRQRMLNLAVVDFEVDEYANPIFSRPFVERAPSAVMVLGYGLYKTLLPFHLSADYGAQVFRLASGFTDPRFCAVLIPLAGFLVAGLVMARRHPLVFVAMTAFLGFSFPTSNLAVPIEALFAERFFYAPALGLSFLLAWLLQVIQSPAGRRVLLGGVTVWLLACGAMCIKRCGDWQDDRTLFAMEVHNQPDSIGLRINAANMFAVTGDTARSHVQLRAVLERAPAHPVANTNLAAHLMGQSKFDEAHALLGRAWDGLSLRDPSSYEARNYSPLVLMNLGMCETRLGRFDSARARFEAALGIQPEFCDALWELLWLAWRHDHVSGVRDLLRRGQMMRPAPEKQARHAQELELHRGILDTLAGRHAVAGRRLQAVLHLRPPAAREARAWSALIESFHRSGRGGEAQKILAMCEVLPNLTPEDRSRFAALARAIR